MMRHSRRIGAEAWAVTDLYGEIQSASWEARRLLGLPAAGGRRNLLQLFPDSYKAMVFDIELAVTGWPTGRTLVLRRPGARTAVVRYQVSRSVSGDRLELFWQLERDETDDVPRCA